MNNICCRVMVFVATYGWDTWAYGATWVNVSQRGQRTIADIG